MLALNQPLGSMENVADLRPGDVFGQGGLAWKVIWNRPADRRICWANQRGTGSQHEFPYANLDTVHFKGWLFLERGPESLDLPVY